ncbi:hypothetical protein BJP36_41685 [Moorena producens JHB]|uniref:Uncharacterized protein n=1 Tax=Moorena producens (strain JHB) TaxID=1454205 RepID=A0A9Q9SSM7_MOOP1|nr:hypothetical protein [Moorena producens]WAN68878.1 hypothetical protein BJP36_41685 [Moorena producens JHB]
MTINTSRLGKANSHRGCDRAVTEASFDPPPMNWLQQITGSFKDEPAFEEVLAYGRAIRQGDESILEIIRLL